jgi:hypothetical protein
MKKRGRILKAFLAASVVTALFFTVVYTVWWMLDSQKPDWHGSAEIFYDILSLFVLYGLSGALVTLLIGLPTYLFYRRLGWQSRMAFALGGAAIGCGTAIILSVLGIAMFLGSTPILAAFCSIAGLLSSLAFRRVAFSAPGDSST